MKLYGGRSHNGKRSLAALIALVLIICVAVGGTIAYIVTQTDKVENKFTPADVQIAIEEDFNGTVKSSITVQNVDDAKNVPCYIRVKLVSNMQDADKNVIGSAAINSFKLGDNWFDGGDGCYYYKDVVNVGASTANLLADGSKITLTNGQVVEVLAEGIQATPDTAVTSAWPVTVVNGQLNKGA